MKSLIVLPFILFAMQSAFAADLDAGKVKGKGDTVCAAVTATKA